MGMTAIERKTKEIQIRIWDSDFWYKVEHDSFSNENENEKKSLIETVKSIF